jgi:Lens epithelium-derived growth factor (LEDGF)/PWWP domain
MAKNANYAVNDLVFAKVKGFCPWPAKITRILPSKKYVVVFFGTKETANIKKEDLCYYKDNKEKLANDKTMKKPHFKQAIEQIESALAGNDPLTESPPSLLDSAEEEKSDDQQDLVIDESKGKKPAAKSRSKPTKAANNDHESDIDSSTNDAKDASIDEKTSKSGRKIKPKKFDDDSKDDIVTPPQKRKFNLSAESKAKIAKTETSPAGESDGISAKILQIECQLVDLDYHIKSSVALDLADPDRCIELLDEYKKLALTPLMLKKNPQCVETIKRLRRYVGNYKSWNMNDEEKREFCVKAEKVRKSSEEIYTKFKKLFTLVDTESPFW